MMSGAGWRVLLDKEITPTIQKLEGVIMLSAQFMRIALGL